MSENEIYQLVENAQKKNLVLDITGILIYNKHEFIQLLGGDEAAVKELYEEIRLDDRHYNVSIFYEGAIEHRGFDGWSMAFKNVSVDHETKSEPDDLISRNPGFVMRFANSRQSAGKKIFRMLSDQL